MQNFSYTLYFFPFITITFNVSFQKIDYNVFYLEFSDWMDNARDILIQEAFWPYIYKLLIYSFNLAVNINWILII